MHYEQFVNANRSGFEHSTNFPDIIFRISENFCIKWTFSLSLSLPGELLPGPQSVAAK